MKTYPPLKRFWLSRLAPLAIVISTALIDQPASAGVFPVGHSITLTETSSTSLSVTYDGSSIGITVLNVAPDQWTVTLPIFAQINPLDVGVWIEPENPLLFNVAGRGNSPANVLNIFSDRLPGEAIPVADGTAVFVGQDSRDGFPITALFQDQADRVEAPETGSTLGLFFLSLIGLFGAQRLRSLRLV